MRMRINLRMGISMRISVRIMMWINLRMRISMRICVRMMMWISLRMRMMNEDYDEYEHANKDEREDEDKHEE